MSRVAATWRLLRWRELRVAAGRCPFCGPTLLLRLADDELALRCARCAASAVHLSIGWAIREACPELAHVDACELSARGPLAGFLRRRARSVALSEYLDGVAPGAPRDGIRCEDVQRLSYADACFDLCTSTEVLEHVPDDARAFAELCRVLRPGGALVFTVPIGDAAYTVERARLLDGRVQHLAPPSYHGDPLRPGPGILCYRDYGRDIVDRLRAAGFAEARLLPPDPRVPFGLGRAVLLARRRDEESGVHT